MDQDNDWIPVDKLQGCAPNCAKMYFISNDGYCSFNNRRLVLHLREWKGGFPIFCPGKIYKKYEGEYI
jgi:hypothetical protein